VPALVGLVLRLGLDQHAPLYRLLAINLGIRDAHYWSEAASSIQGMGIVERGIGQPLAGETRQKIISREAREGERGE
jgi:hypothetical protein